MNSKLKSDVLYIYLLWKTVVKVQQIIHHSYSYYGTDLSCVFECIANRIVEDYSSRSGEHFECNGR